ncbi:MAG: hypothetical protein JST89_08205 [Cyanobacteria bacterium SZAS-4]|nr:hypothetical protein [Cyanobacteria bacterium SZAS-4]
MFDDFTPASELERAFVQACAWEMDRLWKETDRSGDSKDWNRFFGQTSCLVYRCAIEDQTRFLNTVTSAMLDCIDSLASTQQRSLFKVSIFVIDQLLCENLRLERVETRLALRIPIRLWQIPGWSNVDKVEMMAGLVSLFGRTLNPETIDKLAVKCEEIAKSTSKMSDKEHTSLRFSITKYSA